MIALIEQSRTYNERSAILSDGRVYTYEELHKEALQVAHFLLESKPDLREERIGFLIRPSFEYVKVQWGIWLAGGVAVPLCDRHPVRAIQYVLDNSGIDRIIVDKNSAHILKDLNRDMLRVEEIPFSAPARLPNIQSRRRAMILYTSGTTSQPKGVVSTHQNISSQIEVLVKAWQWQSSDHILNILPLHHVHGIINILGCALWSGARCSFLPKFDVGQVFHELSSGGYTVFMAVPTIYFQLIEYWKSSEKAERKNFSDACRRFRLMVSGSAALPVTVLEEWEDITGQRLLERYGMTEIGMALSNPYNGERRAGHVGMALPGVQVRLATDEGITPAEGSPGEIQVKGPGVFLEYWQKAEETRNSFTPDGWFKTGDIAALNNGYYKILGRDSVDIIKSGGYKISALEIEDQLLKHPQVSACAVVGIPSVEWGEVIAAAIVSKDENFQGTDVKLWLHQYLPDYKVPRQYKVMHELPRNTLGKVMKNVLKTYFI